MQKPVSLDFNAYFGVRLDFAMAVRTFHAANAPGVNGFSITPMALGVLSPKDSGQAVIVRLSGRSVAVSFRTES